MAKVITTPEDPWDDGCDENGNLRVPQKSANGVAKKTAPARKPGKPFAKGQSGNPAGRPKESRNKATLLAESLLDGQEEGLILKLIELALAGNILALRFCIERIMPVRQERPLLFDLPPFETPADGVLAIKMIAAGVSRGELGAKEAETLVRLAEAYASAYSIDVLANEVAALKAQMPKSK